MDIIAILKVLTDFGFQTLLTAFFFYFLYKFLDQKFFQKDIIQKQRDIHSEIDAQENLESKKRLKDLQLYLEEHQDKFFNLGIDRVSVWLNHNGMRNGKIHFIFYSLVAEIAGLGLRKTIENPTGNQKLPYYIFADYEERLTQEGPFFIRNVATEMKGAAKSIASDLGIKSMICFPILNIRGTIDGIIFFNSTYVYLDQEPDLKEVANDIRILFIS